MENIKDKEDLTEDKTEKIDHTEKIDNLTEKIETKEKHTTDLPEEVAIDLELLELKVNTTADQEDLIEEMEKDLEVSEAKATEVEAMVATEAEKMVAT